MRNTRSNTIFGTMAGDDALRPTQGKLRSHTSSWCDEQSHDRRADPEGMARGIACARDEEMKLPCLRQLVDSGTVCSTGRRLWVMTGQAEWSWSF